MPSDHLERFLSWARYLYWADILYSRWTGEPEDPKASDPSADDWRRFALAAQWLASVWVVVEGWRELRFSDDVIDKILDAYPDYCDLLRRFRNAVYHFQRELFDERLTAFPASGQETLFWAFALFYEFKRYFWEWPEKHPGTPDEKEVLRSELHRVVGWMPVDLLHAQVDRLRKLHLEAERCLSESADPSSEHATALFASIKETRDAVVGLDKSPLLNVLTRLNTRH
jgi:hypothetical protein